LSRESKDLRIMTDSGKLLTEIWFPWDVRLTYIRPHYFRCSADIK
jgi:hypothetical protein